MLTEKLVTEPKKADRASIFFVTDNNQLVRDNLADTALDTRPEPHSPAANIQP